MIVEVVLAWTMVALFVLAGVLKLAWPSRTRFDADRWRLPADFVFAAGAIELVLAAGFLWPTTRPWSAVGGAAIMVGAIGTQVRVRSWKEIVHPTMTLAVLVWLIVLSW